MKPSAFCYMLKGYLEGKTALNSKETDFLREQLNNVFEHHIDKQYPEDGGLSQSIHDGKSHLKSRPDDLYDDDDDDPPAKKKKKKSDFPPPHPLDKELARC